MPKKLSKQEREFRLNAKYDKQIYDLKQRVKKKYEEKAKEEVERKSLVIENRREIAISNLDVDFSDDKRLKKKALVKPITDYANACKLAQLYSKLIGTDRYWYSECICCPWKWKYPRSSLDGWHCFPKSRSRTIVLDERNIHPQRKYCNWPLWWNWNQERQYPSIEVLHWPWTIEQLKKDMLKLKAPNPKDYIIETLPKARKEFEKKWLPEETRKSVDKFIRKLERRYLII